MSAMDVVYARKRPAASQGARQVTPMRSQPRRDAPVVGLYQARYAQQLNRRGQAARESNYLDVANATYGLNTTGSITLLNAVPQGASVVTRVGKKINMTSLQIRGFATTLASTTSADVTWMIVYDKRPTGATPAITDILDTATSHSFNKDDNSGRFRIIKRVDHTLIGVAGSTARSAVNADSYTSLNGLPVTYKSAGTGVIGDIEEGALYLVTVGNNAAAGNVAGNLVAGTRLRFKDV